MIVQMKVVCEPSYECDDGSTPYVLLDINTEKLIG